MFFLNYFFIGIILAKEESNIEEFKLSKNYLDWGWWWPLNILKTEHNIAILFGGFSWGYNFSPNLTIAINFGFNQYNSKSDLVKSPAYLHIENTYLLTIFNTSTIKMYAGGGIGLVYDEGGGWLYSNKHVIATSRTGLTQPSLVLQTGIEFWKWLVIEYIHREIYGSYKLEVNYQKTGELFKQNIRGPFRSDNINLKFRWYEKIKKSTITCCTLW